jgi:hypothetical protein
MTDRETGFMSDLYGWGLVGAFIATRTPSLKPSNDGKFALDSLGRVADPRHGVFAKPRAKRQNSQGKRGCQPSWQRPPLSVVSDVL